MLRSRSTAVKRLADVAETSSCPCSRARGCWRPRAAHGRVRAAGRCRAPRRRRTAAARSRSASETAGVVPPGRRRRASAPDVAHRELDLAGGPRRSRRRCRATSPRCEPGGLPPQTSSASSSSRARSSIERPRSSAACTAARRGRQAPARRRRARRRAASGPARPRRARAGPGTRGRRARWWRARRRRRWASTARAKDESSCGGWRVATSAAETRGLLGNQISPRPGAQGDRHREGDDQGELPPSPCRAGSRAGRRWRCRRDARTTSRARRLALRRA